MTLQRDETYPNCVNEIFSSQDIPLDQKILFLEFIATHALYFDHTLIYLEARQALRELNEKKI